MLAERGLMRAAPSPTASCRHSVRSLTVSCVRQQGALSRGPAGRQQAVPQQRRQHQLPSEGRRLRNQHVARCETSSTPAAAPAKPEGPTEEQLEADFDLLSSEIAELSKAVSLELKGCSIYLVGMMGSGKSTLGRMLANTLRYGFFDTDGMIEKTHEEVPVAQLFSEHGQEYFRTCETQVMKQLAPYRSLVVATGGGAVLSTQNWGHMQGGVVAWLTGDPALLSRRVAKDGVERRPLLAAEPGTDGDNSEAAVRARAEAKLGAILGDRKKFYENADIVVELAGQSEGNTEMGAPTPLVMHRLLKALDTRIRFAAAEREEKRTFNIEYQREADRPPPSVRTMPIPAAAVAAAAAAAAAAAVDPQQ